MNRERFATVACVILNLILALANSASFQGQNNKNPFPSMAPLDQYLTDRSDEIALARSAAPESISRDATMLVLGRHGYETAVEGKNHWLCLVERSWMSPSDDPDFWNPKIRSPICLNAPAVRSHLPIIMKRTELAIAGRSNAQIAEEVSAAIEKKDLPTPEPNALSYMMSKQGHLNSRDGHWLPHLMFIAPEIDPGA